LIKLSVIIVNYKVPYFLEQCLISVKESCKHIVSEIIVVDNNSTDESCKMIRDKFSDIKLLENKINVGFAKANNQGVKEAQGAYVLILNPDMILAEDTLKKVLDFADQQINPGAIGLRFIDGTGKFLQECKRNIPTFRIANQKIRGNSQNYYANHIKENEIAKVAILTGAFMLLKREVYLNIGGFDEAYFMFGEDIDLSYKLLKKGYQNYYFGETTILHYKGESTIKDHIYLKNFYGVMQIFYKKHYKVNLLSNWISTMVVKSMIVFKSYNKTIDNQQDITFLSLLYIGDDTIKFKKIKERLKVSTAVSSKVLPSDCSAFDLVVFDNSHLTFKIIIEQIQQLGSLNIAKRIIPKNCNFLIGSDSSKGRGEVLKF